MIRLLLDEHVPRAVQAGLQRQSPTTIVRAIGDADAPPRGASDPAILDWCQERDFVLVTNNRATMPVHLADHLAAGGHVPGIIVLDADASLGTTISELTLIAEATLADELLDLIQYLPLRG